MPANDAHSLMVLLAALFGAGVFLRLVGKEKHRREKYLERRLEDQVNELKKQADQKTEQAAVPPIEAKPVTAESASN